MKLFLAGLVAETNSFSSCPTDDAAFEEQGVRTGQDSDADPMGMACAVEAAKGAAEALGWAVAEGLFAAAQPLGPVLDETYARLRGHILEDLRAAMPVGAVVLILHGGMTAETCDDCEGDLISAVRLLVGSSVPIGVSLDPHCHFTQAMQNGANILCAYKEYPHTDIAECAAQTTALTIAAARGTIRPTLGVHDCRMMGLWPTIHEPLKSFVQKLRRMESGGEALSISLGHGMAYGDVPEAGAKIWVLTDNAPERAGTLARSLGEELFAMREAIGTRFTPLSAALGSLSAWRGPKPLALADTADNPGGGAMGDSTFILKALIDLARSQGLSGRVALGGLWDPDAVRACFAAGAGSTVALKIGGRCGPCSGPPMALSVRVCALAAEHSQDDFGARAELGPSALVSTEDGLEIVLISRRQQVLGVDLFTGLGCEIDGLQGIVVKSMHHFQASFAPYIDHVIHVDTPGLLRTDFEALPFKRRDLNYWPRVADPFSKERVPAQATALQDVTMLGLQLESDRR